MEEKGLEKKNRWGAFLRLLILAVEIVSFLFVIVVLGSESISNWWGVLGMAIIIFCIEILY